MCNTMKEAFDNYNNFDNICSISIKKSNGLIDFLKVKRLILCIANTVVNVKVLY